jgi:hypothetical protein
VWRRSGYDFEALARKVLGLKRPLTKFHGVQIETLRGRHRPQPVMHAVGQCTSSNYELSMFQVQVPSHILAGVLHAASSVARTIQTHILNPTSKNKSYVNLQDLFWEDPEFKPLLELLEKDGDVAYMLRDFKAILQRLQACTSSSNPDVVVLE